MDMWQIASLQFKAFSIYYTLNNWIMYLLHVSEHGGFPRASNYINMIVI